MNLHLFHDEKFLDGFIDQMNRSPFAEEQAYVRVGSEPCRYMAKDVPNAPQKSELFRDLVGDFSQYRRVFLHCPHDERWHLPLENRGRTRFYWVFWGAEFYNHTSYPLLGPSTSRLLRQSAGLRWLANPCSAVREWQSAARTRAYCRRAARTLYGILHYDPGEVDLVRRYFGFRGRHFTFFYPNPVEIEHLRQSSDSDRAEIWRASRGIDSSTPAILVGNSGAATNNHAEVLETLARCPEDFRAVVPLSYGDPQVIERIVELGRQMLGERFVPLLDFMAPAEYSDVLASVDWAIFNSYRTQGAGTVYALLLLQKPVFMNGCCPLFRFFKGHGVDVLDTRAQLSQKRLAVPTWPPETVWRNSDIVSQLFSEKAFQRHLVEIFSH